MSKLYTTATYEYMCKGCHEVTEERRPQDDRDIITKCSECGDEMLRKFSSFGFTI